MNYNQMELVEELLTDSPGFIQLFMSEEESFFLRNLETVQGERGRLHHPRTDLRQGGGRPIQRFVPRDPDEERRP